MKNVLLSKVDSLPCILSQISIYLLLNVMHSVIWGWVEWVTSGTFWGLKFKTIPIIFENGQIILLIIERKLGVKDLSKKLT